MAVGLTVPFGAFSAVSFNGRSDVLSVRIQARMGTTAGGESCGGRARADGLRVYFDAVDRPSRLNATFGSGGPGGDTTPPTISAVITPAPNAAGWNKSAATVTFTCADAQSGIDTCTPPVTVSSDTAGQTVTGTAKDKAGNTATAAVTVKLQQSGPSISSAISPQPNAAGWNKDNTTVTFTCTDALSGVASCTGPVAVTAETASQTVTGTGVNVAGNTSTTTTTVKLDKTPPLLSLIAPPATVTTAALTLPGTVTDALSGVATVTCNGAPAMLSAPNFTCSLTLAAGLNQISVVARDNAGNSVSSLQSVTLSTPPPPSTPGVLPGDLDGDGDVDQTDIDGITALIGSRVDAGDPADLDGDRQVTANDVNLARLACTRSSCLLESAVVKVSQTPEIFLRTGDAYTLGTDITYEPSDSVARTVSVTQTLSGSGITLSSLGGSSFTASSRVTKSLSQTLTAVTAGDYTITTMIGGAGVNQPVSIVRVKVSAGAIPPRFFVPAARPASVKPGVVTSVDFTVIMNWLDRSSTPASITLEGVGNGASSVMTDDGLGVDKFSGDGRFSARLNVSSAGLAVGQCLTYRARSGTAVSEPVEVCVSSLAGENPPVTGITLTKGLSSFVSNEILMIAKAGVTEPQVMAQCAAITGCQVLSHLAPDRIYRLRFSPDPGTVTGVAALLTTVSSWPVTEAASYQHLLKVQALAPMDPIPPNDPRYGDQVFNGVPQYLRRINMEPAWRITTGSSSGVAVIDTGIATGHEDLQGAFTNEFKTTSTDYNDQNGHGTLVSGLIAARANNGKGIAGIAPGTRVGVFKVSDTGILSDTSTISAFQEARVDYRIINYSAGEYRDWDSTDLLCRLVESTSQKFGVVVFAGAGNDWSSGRHSPAWCPEAIAVGGTQPGGPPKPSGELVPEVRWSGSTSGSNWGPWVDIAAPANSVLTTSITNMNQFCTPVNGYCDVAGTSIASPMAAAAGALLLSVEPLAVPKEVRSWLQDTVTPLAAGQQIGSGLLNIGQAVEWARMLKALRSSIGTYGGAPLPPGAPSVGMVRSDALAGSSEQQEPAIKSQLGQVLPLRIPVPGFGNGIVELRFKWAVVASNGDPAAGVVAANVLAPGFNVVPLSMTGDLGSEPLPIAGYHVQLVSPSIENTWTGWKESVWTWDSTQVAPPGDPAYISLVVGPGGPNSQALLADVTYKFTPR
ncbi:MAG: S8 family serine peptidase [Bryobacterales bacterium]|nr:S8 family serine peptidase [Bryobacterales bacterium]